jgi:membrane protease YdiL (CAAX protease family)
MTTFQLTALLLTIVWLIVVVTRFRHSTIALVIGLFIIGLCTLVALLYGLATPEQLGLRTDRSWLLTVGFAVGGLAVMLAYSPLADWLAGRWFKKPPTLESFRAIQKSRGNLVAGILAAWVLGGVLEELVARGIVLTSIESFLSSWLSAPVAPGLAVCIAAVGAGAMHSYQGPRAMVIITQLSVLFGVLFVVSGHNLWAVMLCHGLYDTIGCVRFATGKSRYSDLDGDKGSASDAGT